jgi:hypothetical protein
MTWTLLGAPLNSSATPGGEADAPAALRAAGLPTERRFRRSRIRNPAGWTDISLADLLDPLVASERLIGMSVADLRATSTRAGRTRSVSWISWPRGKPETDTDGVHAAALGGRQHGVFSGYRRGKRRGSQASCRSPVPRRLSGSPA